MQAVTGVERIEPVVIHRFGIFTSEIIYMILKICCGVNQAHPLSKSCKFWRYHSQRFFVLLMKKCEDILRVFGDKPNELSRSRAGDLQVRGHVNYREADREPQDRKLQFRIEIDKRTGDIIVRFDESIQVDRHETRMLSSASIRVVVSVYGMPRVALNDPRQTTFPTFIGQEISTWETLKKVLDRACHVAGPTPAAGA